MNWTSFIIGGLIGYAVVLTITMMYLVYKAWRP